MFRKKNKGERRWFFKRKGFWIFCTLCLLLAGIGAYVVDQKLDPYREIAAEYDLSRVGEKKEMSFIHDRNGSEIGTIFEENRFSLPLEEIPEVFVNAVLAQEDQRFYEHNGVDWVGVARAAYLNAKEGTITQGAGTITMQLARKSFDLLGEKKRRGWTGYERKIVEAFVAQRIEAHFHDELRSKYGDDEDARHAAVKARVLEMYLNLVPFGSGFYGVRSASLGYFGKEPDDLTIPECASIVACLKNPQRISPLNDLEENRTNRDHVLNRMSKEGMISESQLKKMLGQPVVVNSNPIRRGKSYLYELLEEQAKAMVGEVEPWRGGYTIRTTIDSKVQKAAEETLRSHLSKVEKAEGYDHPVYSDYQVGDGQTPYLQGASLMIDHQTGEVLAHVGGRDYSHSQYDFIEDGRRPLGTGFFPLVYASAFENGKSPATIVLDEQLNSRYLQVGGTEGVVAEWGMEVINPSHDKKGPITSRHALRQSKIGATVRLGLEVGLEKVHATAREFGLDLNDEKLLSRMLVGFDKVSLREVVSAYSAFPRGGSRVAETHYIKEIRDIDGNLVYPPDGNEPKLSTEEVCSEATAFQVHSILNDVIKEGNLAESTKALSDNFGSGGGKTGTPYGFSDAWMAGYNGRVTCAVWVGFYDGGRKSIHKKAFAKDVAYPVWETMVNKALPDFTGEVIAMPDSIERVQICEVSGMRPTRYCNEAVEIEGSDVVTFRSTSYQEYLRKGEEVGICTEHGGSIDIEALADQGNSQEMHNAVPIKPQKPLLLGYDPYESETPTLGERDDAEEWLTFSDVLFVGDEVKGERESLLILPTPVRFQLPSPAEIEVIQD